jgi:hypothetical protein
MSTRPTVLHTKKGYGMFIFVPIKKNDVATGDFNTGISRIDISRGFKKGKFT